MVIKHIFKIMTTETDLDEKKSAWENATKATNGLWDAISDGIGDLAFNPFFWILFVLAIVSIMKFIQKVNNNKRLKISLFNVISNAWGEIIVFISDLIGKVLDIVKIILHFVSTLEKLLFARLTESILQKVSSYAIVFLSLVSFLATAQGLIQIWSKMEGYLVSFGVQVSILLASFFAERNRKMQTDIEDAKIKAKYLDQKINLLEELKSDDIGNKVKENLETYRDKLKIRRIDYMLSTSVGNEGEELVYIESETLDVKRFSKKTKWIFNLIRIFFITVSITFAYVFIYNILLSTRWRSDNLQTDIELSTRAVAEYRNKLHQARGDSLKIMNELYLNMKSTFKDLDKYIEDNMTSYAQIDLDNDQIDKYNIDRSNLVRMYNELADTLADETNPDARERITSEINSINTDIKKFDDDISNLQNKIDNNMSSIRRQYGENTNLRESDFVRFSDSLTVFSEQLGFIKQYLESPNVKIQDSMDLDKWMDSYSVVNYVFNSNSSEEDAPFAGYNVESITQAYSYIYNTYQDYLMPDEIIYAADILISSAKDYLSKGAEDTTSKESKESFENGCRTISIELLNGIQEYLANRPDLYGIQSLKSNDMLFNSAVGSINSFDDKLINRINIAINDTHVFEQAFRKLLPKIFTGLSSPSWFLALFGLFMAIVPDIGIILLMRMRGDVHSTEILERRKRLLTELMFHEAEGEKNDSRKVLLGICLGTIGGISVYTLHNLAVGLSGREVSSALLLLYIIVGIFFATYIIKSMFLFKERRRRLNPNCNNSNIEENNSLNEAAPTRETDNYIGASVHGNDERVLSEILKNRLQPWAGRMLLQLRTGMVKKYKGFDYMTVVMPEKMEEILLADVLTFRFDPNDPPCLSYDDAVAEGWIPVLMMLKAKDFLYQENSNDDNDNITDNGREICKNGFFVFSNLFMATLSDILATFVFEQGYDISKNEHDLDGNTMDEVYENERI